MKKEKRKMKNENKKIRNLIIAIVIAVVTSVTVPVICMVAFHAPRIKANVEKERIERQAYEDMRSL